MSMNIELHAEHRWLAQLVGEWTVTGEADMGGETHTWTGVETVRAIGPAWIVGESTATMPDGATSRNVVTLGYDPRKQRVVGTFVSSDMTHLWVYEGQLDADGRTLPLDAVGPSFSDPGRDETYRDTLRMNGPDERTLTSHMKNAQGEWTPFMTMTCRRKT